MLFSKNRIIDADDNLAKRLTPFGIGGLMMAIGAGLLLGAGFGLYTGIVFYNAATAVGGISSVILAQTAVIGAIWGAAAGGLAAVAAYTLKAGLGALDWVLVSKHLKKKQQELPKVTVPQNVVEELRAETILPPPSSALVPAPKPKAPKPKDPKPKFAPTAPRFAA